MRLFTGISLPPDVLDNLRLVVEQLRPHAHLKWSPVYNLHITLKFIGEWPEERLSQLISAITAIEKPGAFDVGISGIGWFPNPHSPRVLWAAVKAPDTLKEIAGSIDKALAPLGVQPESKPFSPHLTLARVKDPVPLGALRKAIAGLSSVDFGAFRVERFHLYLSKPGPASSIYTQLADFPIAR